MDRTDRILAHCDEAFAELFHNLSNEPEPRPARAHQLHFEARSARERWRLVKKFTKMALSMLFTGKTQMSFKDKSK